MSVEGLSLVSNCFAFAYVPYLGVSCLVDCGLSVPDEDEAVLSQYNAGGNFHPRSAKKLAAEPWMISGNLVQSLDFINFLHINLVFRARR